VLRTLPPVVVSLEQGDVERVGVLFYPDGAGLADARAVRSLLEAATGLEAQPYPLQGQDPDRDQAWQIAIPRSARPTAQPLSTRGGVPPCRHAIPDPVTPLAATPHHSRLLTPRGRSLTASSRGKAKDVLVVGWSRVPPYGYGRSHGLARILRLYSDPYWPALAKLTPEARKAEISNLVRYRRRITFRWRGGRS
jgi:hypothetical protein